MRTKRPGTTGARMYYFNTFKPAREAQPGRMPRLPRPTLADTVREALREALAEGRFGGFLPAEPRLAEHFGVSRVTLRTALAALRKEGLIAPHRGRPTAVLARPKSPGNRVKENVKTPARVVFLSPQRLHELSPGVLLVFDLLRAEMERAGLALEHRHCRAFAQSGGDRSLEKVVLAEPASVYLLHQAPSFAQTWFAAKGLPAVVVGTPVEDSRLPGVHTDLRATARHAVEHLRAAGHRVAHIGLLVSSSDLPDNRSVELGFIEGGGSAGLIRRHPADADGLRAWIAKNNPLPGANPPTAIIAAWPAGALALIGKLAIRGGKTIPENLSVLCLYDDPAFSMLVPSVTRYRRSPEKYVAILTRLIRRTLRGSAQDAGESRTLFPDLIPGETVAKPRTG